MCPHLPPLVPPPPPTKKKAEAKSSAAAAATSEAKDDDDDVFMAPASAAPRKESQRERVAHIVYKVGDLGLATQISDPHVEEGDCRYLPRVRRPLSAAGGRFALLSSTTAKVWQPRLNPRLVPPTQQEIMQGDYGDLTKADVFALGCTLYEAASGQDLAPNGPEWHKLRDGSPRRLERYSVALNDLLVSMLNPDKALRPSIAAILELIPSLRPKTVEEVGETVSVEQLQEQLQAERQRNNMLRRCVMLGRGPAY